MRARLDRAVVEEQIVAVQVDRHAERALGRGDAGDVIDVRVRQEDVPNRQRPPLGERQQRRDLVARIDEHGLVRLLAADDEAVLEEGTDRLPSQLS